MESPFTPFVRENGFVLLDGALATELERRGADLDDPLWSAKLLIEAPELIETVHYDYFRAGANVATSASYQASFEGFAERGLNRDEAARLLRLSIELARRARDRFWSEAPGMRPLVAASVGPYGAYLHDGSEYRGDYGLSRNELVQFHRRRLEVLVGAGCDLVALETIPSRLEAEALALLLEEFPDIPAWMSFSCRSESEVSHGERFRDCVALASESPSVVAAGVNCTPPQYVSELLASARTSGSLSLVAYPNSGERWDATSKRWTSGGEVPTLPTLTPEWYAAGARILGGCCRTTPETIRAMKEALLRGARSQKRL